MFSWIFFKRSTKESIATASFAERPLKQPSLAYRDYEITLLTFRIMKLKIDAYSIFIKVFPEKKHIFLLS